MARELGLNPKKLGKLDNHKQEPWKTPLPEYIENLYRKQFKRDQPEQVMSIEERVKARAEKNVVRKAVRAEKKQQKETEDAAMANPPEWLRSVPAKAWFESVIPILPVADLEQAVKFYTEKLRFQVESRDGGKSAVISRNGVKLGLTFGPLVNATPGQGRCYFILNYVEKFNVECRSNGVTICHPLKIGTSGMTEFTIADPDRNMITFGERVQEESEEIPF